MKVAKLALSLGVATLAASVLPDGPSGLSEADAQQARPHSRRLTTVRSARVRPAPPANNEINAATRSARASRNRSAANTPGSSGTPPGWTAPPPRPAGSAQAATPVSVQPLQPGELRLSRHLMRESRPPTPVGDVVPTVPMTPEERLRSYSEPSRIRGVPRPDFGPEYSYNWRGIAPSPNAARIAARSAEIRTLQAQLGPKNASAQAARQAQRRSATTVTNAADASPPGWTSPPPRPAGNVQASAGQVTSPPQLPGTLRPARDRMRESRPATPVGNVVPTVPMTPEERLRSYSEPSRIRGVPRPDFGPDYNYNWRGIAPSANPALVAARSAEIRRLQAQLGPRNTSAQAARQAQRRSATTVNNAPDTSPPGWTSPPPRPAGNAQVSTPVTAPPQMPAGTSMSRHGTRDAAPPAGSGSGPQAPR